MKDVKFIQRYNLINGNIIRKETLQSFHREVKTAIDNKSIDVTTLNGKACVQMEKRMRDVIAKLRPGEIIKLKTEVIAVTPMMIKEHSKKPAPGKLAKPPDPLKVQVNKAPKKKPVKFEGVQRMKANLSGPDITQDRKPLIDKPAGATPYGFVTSDKRPQKNGPTFVLPGAVGQLLGQIQQFRYEIIIAGETHSSKSELGMQIADAFADIGKDVAVADWESGGMESNDTWNRVQRNIKAGNRKKIHVTDEVPRTVQGLKDLAKYFEVILIDSGSKLDEYSNQWVDELRRDCPNTIWIILMQQTTNGTTRGGMSAEFDAPVVLKSYRPDENDYKKNYAYVYKNRGNPTGAKYMIASKKIVGAPQPPPPVEQDDNSFNYASNEKRTVTIKV